MTGSARWGLRIGVGDLFEWGFVQVSAGYAFLLFGAVQREQNALCCLLYKIAVRFQRITIDLSESHHFEMKFDSGVPSILAHSEHQPQKYKYIPRLMMLSAHSFFRPFWRITSRQAKHQMFSIFK